MTRIEDLSGFHAVREAGLAKLLPAGARVTVGMGTCGRGNGAEGVYHALAEEIDRTGLDVVLAGVGCFGPCSEEPVVTIRLPGQPLVFLRRVQASDARRIVSAIADETVPSDLAWCKAEEWDHITSQIRFGHGLPDVPDWRSIPFFSGQKKIVLRNCGLVNPEDIEEYMAVGGYEALYKASSMRAPITSSNR